MRRRICTFIALCVLVSLCGCTGFRQSLFDSGLSLERKLSKLEPKTIQVGKLPVSYLERPGSGETIVMLHGFGADKDNWVRFARYIPREYRIIAVDLPGHGDNARDLKTTYSIDYITDGFADTVTALHLDRFHLVGNSMGGYVGTLYSSDHPGKVLSLCLIDPAGAKSPQPSDRELALMRGVNPLVPKTKAEFDELLTYGFHKQPFMPWPARTVLAEKYMERSEFNQKLWNDVWENRLDIADYFENLTMPVLLFWGDKDRIIHISTVSVFEKGIPQIKTVIFRDCGHMPMLEIPKETAHIYTSFLQGTLKDPRSDSQDHSSNGK